MRTTMNPFLNKIDKLPVVILPLEDYEKMREDLDMLRSKSLPRAIKKARKEIKEGKIFTLGKVKNLLDLS